MFDWIYNLPALWVIVLFEAVFVGVCWLGTLFLRPPARSWLRQEPRRAGRLGSAREGAGWLDG